MCRDQYNSCGKTRDFRPYVDKVLAALSVACVLGAAPVAGAGDDTKLEVVLRKEHRISSLPPYEERSQAYTSKQCAFVNGNLLYAVRPLEQHGELCAFDVAVQRLRRVSIPQPAGFKPTSTLPIDFEDPRISINGAGDALCRWTINGNGDHGIALLKKGADSAQVGRVDVPLGSHCVASDFDGSWYIIQWSGGADFTVFRVDDGLKMKRLGRFEGKGFQYTDILDARFASANVLHLLWSDVVEPGENHLRVRCVDFDVKQQKWSSEKELFRLNAFVSSSSAPTIVRLDDGSLHYFWQVYQGGKKTETSGLYHHAGATERTTLVCKSDYGYRAVAAGNRVVVCYTLAEWPEKVFFRVLAHGGWGPATDLLACKGRRNELGCNDILIAFHSDRIWFADCSKPTTLYEFEVAERP